MFRKVNLFYVLLLCSILNIALGADECKECMDNGVWCVDDSSYYVCTDGENPSNKLITCPKGTSCTNSPGKVCLKESEITGNGIKKVCSSDCGNCPGPNDDYKRFVCVSRTQFDMCSADNEPTDQLSTCDDGEICSADSYKKDGRICVPECVMDFYKWSETCHSDEIVTTTKAPVPTLPTETLTDRCIAADDGSFKTFNIDYEEDNTCTMYIVCQNFGTAADPDWDAAILTCKKGLYFNTSKCEATVPDRCKNTKSKLPKVIENM